MKKMLIFTVVMGILAFGANAFALTGYDVTDTLGERRQGGYFQYFLQL